MKQYYSSLSFGVVHFLGDEYDLNFRQPTVLRRETFHALLFLPNIDRNIREIQAKNNFKANMFAFYRDMHRYVFESDGANDVSRPYVQGVLHVGDKHTDSYQRYVIYMLSKIATYGPIWGRLGRFFVLLVYLNYYRYQVEFNVLLIRRRFFFSSLGMDSPLVSAVTTTFVSYKTCFYFPIVITVSITGTNVLDRPIPRHSARKYEQRLYINIEIQSCLYFHT